MLHLIKRFFLSDGCNAKKKGTDILFDIDIAAGKEFVCLVEPVLHSRIAHTIRA